MSSFEVQRFAGGQWTIEMVAHDRDSAIFEAQRLLQSKRVRSVRVVQEIYDANSDSYRMKIIFRREHEAGSPAPTQSGGANPRGAREISYEEEPSAFTKFTRKLNAAISAFVNSMAFVLIKFAIIVGLGVGLLVTLNNFASKL